MTPPGFLFCSDPLGPRRPDPGFAEEAAAARRAGARAGLIDHDALLAGDTETAVGRVRRDSGPYWYRGWMIPPDRYADLERALLARGCSLLTGSSAYRTAHELPGWYEAFAQLTPRSVWRALSVGEALPDPSVWSDLAGDLGPGPGIVKDFVKSRKHEWHEACFVPELSEPERLTGVVGRFLELQGEFLAGGVVLRAYEPFVPGGEARVWWVDGEPVRVTAHPDTPGLVPAPALDAVGEAVRTLGCRWVTTDMALREDGVWRVVEVGDGQVSGLPAGDDCESLFGALLGG
ncbi:ATP-grasp domain-containing protein [Streptomyces sp. For3]|uniref:ATP-grasp domain-containing protein n=1 Tax=Streptomyces silvae TaxID=2803812 RepID=UPI0019247E99|nr:ATP-grasp domain-containing protein [Streptomyces silvae]MBL1290332.1 ATP-grasp domain-containing protein [Streptomyces silvae]